MRIVITGGSGNLGQKLAMALAEAEWAKEIVLLDVSTPPVVPAKSRYIDADLSDALDNRWRDEISGAGAVVHLATTNRNASAAWPSIVPNLDMTANILANLMSGACRLVNASTSHVLSGYKEKNPAPASLDADTPPLPTTREFAGTRLFRSRFKTHSAYASAKLAAERMMRAAAIASNGRVTAVSLRLGYILPGENRPHAIAVTPHRGSEKELRWYRQIWLSNRDFTGITLAALRADASGWPEPAIVVNAMSRNNGMAWSLEATEKLLGYSPQDDVDTALAEDAKAAASRV